MPSKQPQESAVDDRIDVVFQVVVSAGMALRTFYIVTKSIPDAEIIALRAFAREGYEAIPIVQRVERLGFATA